jgi:hypothetical protein
MAYPQKQKTRAPSGERVSQKMPGIGTYEKTLARLCRVMQQQQQLLLMDTRIWQSFCIRPAVLQKGAKVVKRAATDARSGHAPDCWRPTPGL